MKILTDNVQEDHRYSKIYKGSLCAQSRSPRMNVKYGGETGLKDQRSKLCRILFLASVSWFLIDASIPQACADSKL